MYNVNTKSTTTFKLILIISQDVFNRTLLKSNVEFINTKKKVLLL